MKESLYSLDRRCVFRESFSSESEVRANGGISTNVVFENGVGKFNGTSSDIKYLIKRNTLHSIRLKILYIANGNIQVLYDTRNPANGGMGTCVYVGENNKLNHLLGVSLYVNGVSYANNSITLTANQIYDIILTTDSANTMSYLTIGKNYGNAYPTSCSIELFEIYQGTLTANEVLSLYQNSMYKQPALPHGEILGPELVVNGGFDNGYIGWNPYQVAFGGTNTIVTGNGFTGNALRCEYSTQVYGGVEQIILTVGKRYRVRLKYRTNISFRLNTLLSVIGILSNNTSNALSSEHTFIADSPVFAITLNDNTGWFEVDDVSVREVISTANLILDVNAYKGVIRNSLSGGLLSNLIVNGTFDTDISGWTVGNHPLNTVLSFTNNALRLSTNSNDYGSVIQSFPTIIGKTYSVSVSTKDRNCQSWVLIGIAPDAGNNYNSQSFPSVNKYDITFTATAFTSYITLAVPNGAGNYIEYDDIQVREIIPSVIPTNVKVIKDGGVNVMRFNNSKVDCGSYNGLVGDITISIWTKMFSWGYFITDQFGAIIHNTKLAVACRKVAKNIGVQSNLTEVYTEAQSPDNSVDLTKYYNILLTRKASGATTYFINGKVSGSSDLASGTPSSGSNICIGNSAANTFGFNGNIASVQIYSGLLNAQEISELYTSQKSKLNL